MTLNQNGRLTWLSARFLRGGDRDVSTDETFEAVARELLAVPWYRGRALGELLPGVRGALPPLDEAPEFSDEARQLFAHAGISSWREVHAADLDELSRDGKTPGDTVRSVLEAILRCWVAAGDCLEADPRDGTDLLTAFFRARLAEGRQLIGDVLRLSPGHTPDAEASWDLVAALPLAAVSPARGPRAEIETVGVSLNETDANRDAAGAFRGPPAGLVLHDSVWCLRVPIGAPGTGSGDEFPIAPRVAYQAGVAPGASRTLDYGDFVLILRWVGTAPQLIDLEQCLDFFGCVDGDRVFLPLSPDERHTAWLVDGDRIEAAHGHERLALELGAIDGVRAEALEDVADVLGLPTSSPDAIRAALLEQGEPELAALVESASALPAELPTANELGTAQVSLPAAGQQLLTWHDGVGCIRVAVDAATIVVRDLALDPAVARASGLNPSEVRTLRPLDMTFTLSWTRGQPTLSPFDELVSHLSATIGDFVFVPVAGGVGVSPWCVSRDALDAVAGDDRIALELGVTDGVHATALADIAEALGLPHDTEAVVVRERLAELTD